MTENISKPDEMLEVSPIMDIIDMLEFKKTLTLNEINILTQCITQKFSDINGKIINSTYIH